MRRLTSVAVVASLALVAGLAGGVTEFTANKIGRVAVG